MSASIITWIRRKPRAAPYDLIGVTATTPLMPDAWAMAQLGKKRGLITVLGGPHLTIMPLESLQPPHDEYVDYVFKGEAEYSSSS
jgi:protein-L-isoaspartate O-methyltransferase